MSGRKWWKMLFVLVAISVLRVRLVALFLQANGVAVFFQMQFVAVMDCIAVLKDTLVMFQMGLASKMAKPFKFFKTGRPLG